MSDTSRLRGAGTALLVAALLTACGAVPQRSAGPGPGAGTAAAGAPAAPAPAATLSRPPSDAGAGPSEADTAFVRQVLARHQQAVDLAGLAVDRAASPEARALADDLLRVHGWEMTEAAAWLQEHGSLAEAEAPGPADAPAATTTPEETAALLAAEGEDFDRLFLELMARHHRATVDLARIEQEQGRDAGARNLSWLVDEGRTGELERITALQRAS